MLNKFNQAFLWCFFSLYSSFGFSDFQNHQLEKQRANYSLAKDLLEKGQLTEYQQIKGLLSTYPLLPYLEFQEINKQLHNLPYSLIDQFLDRHKDTYIGDLLLRNWLSVLASKNRWHEYRSYFSDNINSTAHKCWLLLARVNTGDKQALNDVSTLWNVSRSQPKSCDSLFDHWKQKGYLTEDLIWQRFVKATLRNKTSLRRYLTGLMNEKNRKLADLFWQSLKNPQSIENKALFKNDHPNKKSIVYHTLRRYIRPYSDTALAIWNEYDALYSFTDSQKNTFFNALAKRHAFDGKPKAAKALLDSLNHEQKIVIIEIIIRHFLEDKDWSEVDKWISLLPDDLQNSERWQYWRARSYESLNKSEENYLPIYTALAKKRNFYGFLSADFLEQAYSYQDSPVVVEEAARAYLEKIPAFSRARELYFLNKMPEARQEWRYALYRSPKPLETEQFEAAALLAAEWGWHRKSIEAMTAATSWNDLSTRFPTAHAEIIQTQAKKLNLPATLLFAIARQESAWESDAKSSAGALGLMQIMPRTAKETARKAGIAHSNRDLLQPQHNITLGSRYIEELLASYDGNRVPAIAAYNAGPHRVNRWLERTDGNLPKDIWIEVIPFGETRKYVQNVLSYSLIYSHRMGLSTALLTQNERDKIL